MVTAYPVRGKQKSLDICRAFVEGCGGIVDQSAERLHEGAAFFYGVDASNIHLWEQVRSEGREFYYCDNSYFDKSRQQYFRVTKNRLQHSGLGVSDCARFAALRIPVQEGSPDFNVTGHIVVCPQSDWFMSRIAGFALKPGVWLDDALMKIARWIPSRPVRVRDWSPDKAKLSRSLPEDLLGAMLLVTHSSAAAVTALLSGVPVLCDRSCAAFPFTSRIINDNLQLVTHSASLRTQWAGVLADNQWTLDEMRNGFAWGMING